MSNQLKHYGVLGMKWGHRRAGGSRDVTVGKGVSGVVKEVKGLAKDAIKDDINKVSSVAKRIGEKHQENMKKLRKELPKINDKVGTAFGMRKDSKGQWILTPEAVAKSTTLGIALGFTSFFAEMKIRDFVASKGIEKVVQSAEYAKWLANG